jgi:hypothetical protein
VTGDSDSLVDMQSGAVANDLAFVKYDLALINANHGPQLVVEDVLPALFDVFREPDPVADREGDLLLFEHAELPRLVKWQLILDAIFPDNDSSLFAAKHLPLLAAFKTLFFDSTADDLNRCAVHALSKFTIGERTGIDARSLTPV